ncbi:MAG: hemerythrin domain-containing protein [Rhodocyclaceae bacterium]|nr:hemerythrin domain-containing protein [Rhodocyclaceae bacterium]
MQNRALSIIQDEHRCLGAVLHGLRYVIRSLGGNGKPPDFKLIWAMLYYMDAFSQRLHDPREEAYLFARLKQRTHEADETIAALCQEHAESAQRMRALEQALGRFEAGVPGAAEAFVEAAEAQIEAAWRHMATEERVILPLAKRYLHPEDWAEIAEAFGEKGDPRFGPKPAHEFRELFTRIVNLAPPPIGVGPGSETAVDSSENAA